MCDHVKLEIISTPPGVILYDSMIPAGFPSPAEGMEGQPIDLNDYCVRNPSSTFFAKAKGKSMEAIGIFENSLLVVDRSVKPTPNSTCILFYNGEFTVKKVRRMGGKVILKSLSYIRHPDIEIENPDDLVIWGVVIKIISDPQ